MSPPVRFQFTLPISANRSPILAPDSMRDKKSPECGRDDRSIDPFGGGGKMSHNILKTNGII